MKSMILSLLSVFLFSLTVSAQNNELKKLAKWMAGSYSSYEQHIKDSANYYHIKLDMIPIWEDRTDGYWFYVEQALAGYESRPYRQRVYRLFKNFNGELVSAIYTFPNPKKYAQHWAQFEQDMTAEDCTEKMGCSVYLTFDDGVFVGGTDIGTCSSIRNGSKYATAEVQVYKYKLISWDRGWDANDNYVWGAENAGYIFLKD